MQISTKVVTATHVILNQDELKDAVIAYVKANTEFPDDAKFEVDFGDDNQGDLEAFVDITGTTATTEASAATAPAAPKPAPKTRSAAVKTEPPQSSAPVQIPAATKPEPTQEDPPFVPDVPKAELLNGASKTEPVNEAPKGTETKAEAKTTLKIFPDAATSAPKMAAVPEIDPAVKAKSLFANLSKPTN